MTEKGILPFGRQVCVAVSVLGCMTLLIESLQVRLFAFFIGSISHFLAIPCALLGLCLGSLFLSSLPQIGRGVVMKAMSIWLPLILSVVFLLFFLSANVLFPDIHISLSTPLRDLNRLLIYSGLFVVPYIISGILLARLIEVYPSQVGFLYFCDLLGAAFGCLLGPVLLNSVGLHGTIYCILCLGLGVSGTAMSAKKAVRAINTILVLGVILADLTFGVFNEAPRPEIVGRTLFGESNNRIVRELSSSWNALARTALLSETLPNGDSLEHFGIVQDDGISNVRINRYKSTPADTYAVTLALPHSLPAVLEISPHSILVMFAGVGADMVTLDRVFPNSPSITGVELNPQVVQLIHHKALLPMRLTQFFAQPNITLEIDEGRRFLERTTETFDLIFVGTSGSVQANRTGHVRKYLDTIEALDAYLSHLSEFGTLYFVNQEISHLIRGLFEVFPRYSEAPLIRSMFITRPADNPEVYSLLVKRGGLSFQEEAALFRALRMPTKGTKQELMYSPSRKALDGELSALLEESEDQRKAQLVTDDRPFIRRITDQSLTLIPSSAQLKDQRFASNWIRVFTLGVLLLISLIVIRVGYERSGVVGLSGPWITYFFVSGIAYMFVEIGIAGRAELILGNPLYAMGLVLAAFLSANAVGSLRSAHALLENRIRFIVVPLLTGFFCLACLEVMRHTMLAWTVWLKAPILFLSVFPLGYTLGHYYPLGVRALIGRGVDRLIPLTYSFAALSSVLGSSFAIVMVTEIGFSMLIWSGLLGYSLLAVLFNRLFVQ